MKQSKKIKGKLIYPVIEQNLNGIRCEVVIPYKAKSKRMIK